MRETLLSYIAACDENIKNYMMIADAEERNRALLAAHGMKSDFEKMLQEYEKNA